jgi:outer membrane protein assembly factor BamB
MVAVALGVAVAGQPVLAAAVAQGSSTYQVDPAHDGSITFPTRFAPPLKKRWSVDLGGPVSYPVAEGNLTFVIAGGAVGAHIVALNTKTGKTVWQRLVNGDYASSYLAYDDGRLFVSSENSPLQTLDAASGRLLWSVDLGISFGFVPVASNGLVYAAGSNGSALAYGLLERNGSVYWGREFVSGGSGATLGAKYLYFPIPCDVPAMNPTTGHVAWNYYGGCSGAGGAIAAYYRNVLYVPNSDNSAGGGIIFNANTGRVLDGYFGGLPAFHANQGYSISGRSLVATNIVTGNITWSAIPKTAVSMPPIVVNGNVYTLSNSGLVYVNNGVTGKLVQAINVGLGTTNQPNAAPFSGLGVGPGVLLVPSGTVLAAFAP